MAMAVDELDQELAVYEVTPMRRESITIEVPAGSLLLPQYPVDYVETVRLFERLNNTSDQFAEVTERLAVSQSYIATPIQHITEWVSRNNLIYINPPSLAREVMLEFVAGLTTPATSGTAVDIESSRLYLGLVTARNAARDAGNSVSTANKWKEDIDRARDRVVRRLQKSVGTTGGVRRRAYRGRG